MELVRVFLWEKDVETACREAVADGCTDDLWMELARKREQDYPEDALGVYRRMVEPTLNRTNKEAYRDAVGPLKKVKGLIVRLNRKAEFADYLESVRTAHKRKRNFMKMLDREKWV